MIFSLVLFCIAKDLEAELRYFAKGILAHRLSKIKALK